jgi:hypothetical protein
MRSTFFGLMQLISWSLLVSGCAIVTPDFATVTYYDYGAGIPDQRPLDPYPVTLQVKDLRPLVVSHEKEPQFVGVAENGFGEPRDVLNRDDCPIPVSVHQTPHCRSLAESLRERLQWPNPSASNQDSKGSVLIDIRQWQTHAGSDLRLDYALHASLRSASGETLTQVDIHGAGERIDTRKIGVMTFANHEAKEYLLSLIVSAVLDEKLHRLVSGPFAGALSRLR